MRKPLLFLLTLTLLTVTDGLRAQGTAFTYQGQLQNNGSPANGTYSFAFSLYNTNAGGSVIGTPVTNNAVGVTNGLFTTPVDFGNGAPYPFNTGQALWLEIVVRTNGAPNFFTLNPRQPLTPAPYAIYSANAASAGTLSVAGNQTLNLTANGNTVVRIASVFDPSYGSYTVNSVGGYSGNVVNNGYFGGFIGGGGNSGAANIVGANYASVLGGLGNAATGFASTAMGNGSTASGPYSTAMGSGSIASGFYCTAMGYSTASDDISTAMGHSTASGYASTAMGSSTASGLYSTAMGASTANGYGSTAMGVSTASANFSTAMGSGGTASGYASTAMGNRAQALHDGVFVWADSLNADFASTANNQFLVRAAGGVGINTTNPLGTAFCVSGDARLDAQPLAYNEGLALNFPTDTSGSGYGGIHFHSTAHNGAFGASSIKWGMFYNYAPGLGGIGGNGLAIAQNNTSTRLFFATNGSTTFYSNPGQTAGVTLAAGSSAWTTGSDRNIKENFKPVNTTDVLEKVAALPLTTWNYKSQDAGIHHLGPMAQDFKVAFGLGESATGISTVDEEGVALAAIQGLNQKLNERDKKINKQQQEIDEIKASEKATFSKLQTQFDQTVAEKKALLKRIAAVEARDLAREDRLARLESGLEKVSAHGAYASLGQ